MSAPLAAYNGKRYLSHVEIVHRPGERDLAAKFLGLLGIELEDAMGGRFMMAVIDKETYRPAEFANFFGGSEVHPEQWAFDKALIDATSSGPLAQSFAEHQAKLDRDPTSGQHIGIHFPAIADWEAAVARLESFAEDYPELMGRVRMPYVMRPGEPGSFTPLHQAFVWTDILSGGSLAIGQRIELSALDRAAIPA